MYTTSNNIQNTMETVMLEITRREMTLKRTMKDRTKIIGGQRPKDSLHGSLKETKDIEINHQQDGLAKSRVKLYNEGVR